MTRIAKAVLAGVLAGGTAVTGWSSPARADPTLFQFRNDFQANRCLDAKYDAGGNPGMEGDPVQIWDCSGGVNQKWYRELVEQDSAGNAWYRIRNWFGGGLCLDAKNDGAGNPNQDGDPVQMWTCGVNSPWQEWRFLNNSTIKNHFGLQKCLDAKGDGGWNPGLNGDPVQLWTCSPQNAQQRWSLNRTLNR